MPSSKSLFSPCAPLSDLKLQIRTPSLGHRLESVGSLRRRKNKKWEKNTKKEISKKESGRKEKDKTKKKEGNKWRNNIKGRKKGQRKKDEKAFVEFSVCVNFLSSSFLKHNAYHAIILFYVYFIEL